MRSGVTTLFVGIMERNMERNGELKQEQRIKREVKQKRIKTTRCGER